MTTTEIKAYLASIGKRGGSSKSPAKVASSRANGLKGGRKPKATITDTGSEGIGSSRGIVREYNPAVGTWTPIIPQPPKP